MTSKKILYVCTEEEDSTLLIFKRVNNLCGGEIAQNKQEVSDRLENENYLGVLMTGLRYGNGDYLERCREGLDIVEEVKKKGLPLVLITGASEELIKVAYEKGATKVIRKPIKDLSPFQEALGVFER